MQKTKKRVLSLFLAVVMVLTLVPMSAIATNTDITGHWAEDTLLKWSELGWFNGNGSGTYRPNSGITRAEFMALVNRMEGYSDEYAGIGKFTDLDPSAWYYDTVSAALAAGCITGTSDTTVAPEAQITRQEAFIIIARISGLAAEEASVLGAALDGNAVADWAKPMVAAAVKSGLAAGSDGKLNPLANVTRAETVVMLDRVLTDSRVLGFAGTYGPAAGELVIDGDVTIAASGVNLQNMKINKNLTVASSVGEGEAYINSVTVLGDVLVEGGGVNSLYLADFRVEGSMIVRKYAGENVVRIVVSGDCNFDAVILETGAVLVTQQLSDGTKISVEIPTDFLEGSTFEFIGDFDNIVNNGEEADITITGSVNKLTLNESTTVSGTGKITIAEVSKAAGEGTVFVDTKPVSLTGGGSSDVTLPSTTGGSSGTGSTGGGGGGSQQTSETVASVDALTENALHNGEFTLPATVTAKLARGGTKSFAVTWEPATASTDACGVFEFTGTLTMVSGYVNTNNVKASLTLTVTPVLESIAVTQLPTNVLYNEGDGLDTAGLIVTATYSDGSTKAVDADDYEVSGYVAEEVGEQTITVTCEGKTATFNVTVFAVVESGTLVSIALIADITLGNGAEKTAAGLNLPDKVEIEVDVDDNDENVTVLADIEWNVDSGSYTPETKTKQTFTVSGTVTLPTEIENPEPSILLNVSVSVTVEVAKYTVSFDLNGQSGTEIAAQTINYSEKATAPDAPTSTSHNFSGWYTNAAGTGDAWAFDTNTVDEDITLYAIWAIKTYTISFDKGNAEGNPELPEELTVEHGSAAAKPEDPTDEGLVFAGWYTDSNLTAAYDWSTAVTSSFTLYANFVDALTQAKEALTFDVIKGGNDTEQGIMTNLALPASLTDHPGVAITWASSDTDVIAINGTVTRPGSEAADATVTLTATLSAGGGSQTKEFTLVVRKQGVSDVVVEGADSRFAPGYPVVSFGADGKATLKLKLKDDVATEAAPVVAYIVFDSRSTDYYTLDKESILYGHTVSVREDDGKHRVWPVSEIGELILEGSEEYTLTADSARWYRNMDSYKIGVVLLENDDIDDPLATGTVITLTADEVGYVDVTAPDWMYPFLSKDGKKIHVYFDEELSTAAGNKPAPGDFTLEDTGATVTGVSIINDTSSSSYMPGRIELMLSGAVSSVSDLKLKYTPGMNKLADTSTNMVEYPIDNDVYTDAPSAKLYINPTEGTALVVVSPGQHFWDEYSNYSKSTELVTIKHNGTPLQNLTNVGGMWGPNDTETLFTFTPLASGSYNATDFTLDIASGFTLWNMDTIVVTGQVATQSLPAVTTDGVTAEYNSEKGIIIVTLPEGVLLSLENDSSFAAVGCNFILSVDGNRLLYRDETRNNHWDENYENSWTGDENQFCLPLTARLIDAIENGSEITLSYAPEAIHTYDTYTHLSDITGAYIPNFGPVLVSK